MNKTNSLNTHRFEHYGIEHCFEFRALNFDFLIENSVSVQTLQNQKIRGLKCQ